MKLDPGERVIFEGHPSWRSILTFYLKAALLVAVAAGVAALASAIAEGEVKETWSGLVVLAGAAVLVMAGFVKRIFTTYTITNRRLYIQRGFLSRNTQETQLHRAQNVNTHQSVLERLLQVGTVNFDTAGSGDYDFAFSGVSDPDEVVQAVNRAQHEAAMSTAGGDGL
jgi:uncharacterized membrane protein YdbT with pleckstrin-like domain